jgi:hypothetical protein
MSSVLSIDGVGLLPRPGKGSRLWGFFPSSRIQGPVCHTSAVRRARWHSVPVLQTQFFWETGRAGGRHEGDIWVSRLVCGKVRPRATPLNKRAGPGERSASIHIPQRLAQCRCYRADPSKKAVKVKQMSRSGLPFRHFFSYLSIFTKRDSCGAGCASERRRRKFLIKNVCQLLKSQILKALIWSFKFSHKAATTAGKVDRHIAA